MTSTTIDPRKIHPELYRAGAAPTLVTVPPLRYLAVDGTGDPGGDRYAASVGALYAVAYGIRFALRAAGTLDARVAPLEGLWSGAEGRDPRETDRDAWRWTMLIMLPDRATGEVVAAAVAAVGAKRHDPGRPGPAPEVLAEVRVVELTEGCCAQVLHTGPYAEEPATLDRLHAFIAGGGYRIGGRHHEIYLNDPRRTAPERLRTILRYPLIPAAAAGSVAAG
jgi:hypothetical protein